MKFGIRRPSFKKRIAARTSWKRYVRHNLGFKAPRGWGWLTNPRKAAYNRVYNRTSVSIDRVFKGASRRGTRHDGSALLLVVGIIVVATLGVYLLWVAAIVLVAWLVRVATKRPAPAARGAIEAIAAPPPDAEYQPVADVEPGAFTDVQQTRATASRVFDAWLQHIPKAPKHGADLVRDIAIRTRLVGRLTTELDRRRYVWRSLPMTGRQTVGSPPLDPANLDPWNPPADLKAASRHIATCSTCSGEGRVTCTSCGGTSRTGCEACAGAGKYYGTAANGSRRLLNCKTCKGKREVVCPACSRGSIDCPTCQKAKRVERWLEVEESTRTCVVIAPDGDVIKAFAWGHDASSATEAALASDARILVSLARARGLMAEDLPSATAREWQAANWAGMQPAMESGERVRSQAFTLLEIPSTEVTYSVLGHDQVVAFEGTRMLAPPPWSDVLFARRAGLLSRSRLALAMLPIAALVIYAVRGTYFLTSRPAPLVAGVVCAAAATAICAYAVLWYATLGRRTAIKWAGAAIAPIATATALAILAAPTADRARAYINAGQLAPAEHELGALGAPTDSELAPIWADLHLKQALAATSCEAAKQTAAQIARGLPQRRQADAHADELAVGAAKRALQAGDPAAADSAIRCASPGAQDAGAGLAVRAETRIAVARKCLATSDWECIFQNTGPAAKLGASADADEIESQATETIREGVDAAIKNAAADKDLGRRVSQETTALALWTTYLASRVAKEPAAIATLRSTKARDEQTLARQEEAERRRQEAAEKQRLAAEERERKRQEAAAAEAERRNRPVELYCNDGTISGCGCARSSFQGCCSHHHGVEGCHQ